MKRITLPLVALAGAVALAGCGGSSSGGSDKALSKDEFVSQANAICAKANKAIKDLGQPSSPDQLADFTEKAYAASKEQVAALKALTPPSADSATITALWATYDQLLGAEQDVVDAAKDGDASAMEAVIDANTKLDEQASAAARAYGLTECAKNAAA